MGRRTPHTLSHRHLTSSSFVVFFFSLATTTFNQIVAEGGDGEEIVYGKLDLSLLGKYREALPSLKHIRKDIFHV